MGRKSITLLGSITLVLMLASLLLIGDGVKPAYSQPARAIPSLVSTDWLEDNLGLPNLVILDIRSPEQYNVSHIEGAINVPEAEWYILDPAPPFTDPLYMELPPDEELFDLIGGAGITKNSLVVVVGSTSGLLLPEAPLALYNAAGITRVAITLLYAGVGNASILDGGYDKWVKEGRLTSTVPVTPTPVTYTGDVDETMFVSKDYVLEKIGESVIIDARDPEVYFGFIQEPWAQKVGHIPTAKNLPTPWLWSLTMLNETHVNYGTYKSDETLKELANDIVGTDMTKEIIVYCGVGGYASTMFFVPKEVLGYTNVKIYDGSAQEWTSYPELPVVYEDLGSQYLQLSANYTQLLGDYNDLQSDYEDLTSDYEDLTSDYENLTSEYQDLTSDYQNLTSDYEDLTSDYEELTSDYEDLTSDYEDLKKATTPAYLTYSFILTTIIFVLIAIYLALKARTKKG